MSYKWGITGGELHDLCVEIATIRLQTSGITLNDHELDVFRLGASNGALAMINELQARLHQLYGETDAP